VDQHKGQANQGRSDMKPMTPASVRRGEGETDCQAARRDTTTGEFIEDAGVRPAAPKVSANADASVVNRLKGTFKHVLLAGALACAALTALIAAPDAQAQAAICERVKPPPSVCFGEDGPYTPEPPPPPPAPAPTDLHVTGRTTHSISLAWTDRASDEHKYWLERVMGGYWRTVPGGHLDPSVGTGGRMTFTDAGLEAGHNYRYRVRVINRNTSFSPTIDASTVAILQVTVSAFTEDLLHVQWNPIEGATGYTVEQREPGTGAPFTPIATLGPEARSHWARGLAPATQYEFRVTAQGVPADAYVTIPGSGRTAVPAPRTDYVNFSPNWDRWFDYWGSSSALIPSSARILSVRNVSVDRNGLGLKTINLTYQRGSTTVTAPTLGYDQTTSAFNGLSVTSAKWQLGVTDTSALFLWDCLSGAPETPSSGGCVSRAQVALEVTYQ
jgi:hypothetical protein